MANPLLEVKELSVSYGDVRALHDVFLEVEEGSIVALVGANGAGKSTLLKTISGLLHPVNGAVLFEGEDLIHTSTKHRVDK
ncbi:MAG: ATP-binding cassette domain-containing protein, partial [Planctomycetota bacterium]